MELPKPVSDWPIKSVITQHDTLCHSVTQHHVQAALRTLRGAGCACDAAWLCLDLEAAAGWEPVCSGMVVDGGGDGGWREVEAGDKGRVAGGYMGEGLLSGYRVPGSDCVTQQQFRGSLSSRTPRLSPSPRPLISILSCSKCLSRHA